MSQSWEPLVDAGILREEVPGLSGRVMEAIRSFDAANSRDPTSETWNGSSVPAARLYGERMTRRLLAFAPAASETLHLAARAQHLERWTISRSNYPEGKRGYHQWRSDLARYHANRAGEILLSVGYAPDTIARVQSLLRKERLKLDPEAQLLEDVACLVFLEHYSVDFARKHAADKVVDILRKAWRKMSANGHQAALRLQLPPAVLDLILQAIHP